jgi:hypothetical protein
MNSELPLLTPIFMHVHVFTHAHAHTNPHTHMQTETDKLNSQTTAVMSSN